MKLSMWMIMERLEKYVHKVEIKSGRQSITGVRFFSGDMKSVSPEYVYIGKASEVFSDEEYKDTLLLVHGHDWIFIENEDFETILNELLGAFDYYSTWESSLWESSNYSDPLQRLIDVSRDIIPYPMRFAGIDGKVAAISKNYDPDEVDARWKGLHETGYITVSVGRMVTTVSGVKFPRWTQWPQEYIFSDTQGKYIAATIEVDNESVASLMIWEKGKPFSPCVCQLADILCKVFTTIVAKQIDKHSDIRSSAVIITDLIEGRAVPEANIKRLDMGGGSPPWQLVAMINSLENRDLLVKKRVLGAVQRHINPGMAMIYEDDVVIIVNSKTLKPFLEKLDSALYEQYIVGISLPFTDWNDLPVKYKQAVFAQSQGSERPGIYYCKDYAFEHLIESVKQHNLALELTHPALEALERYDRIQKTELYKTLFIYISNERNLVSTAEALFIHRNTLVFRIKRITGIIDADLDDPSERAYILLSYTLRGEKFHDVNLNANRN